jgi:amino acid adenylation domain-containing protein
MHITGLGGALEAAARQGASRLAVHSRAYRWTYAELLARARGVTMAIGGGTGQVGILAEHDAPGLAALCGALLLRRTFVPLDPAWPAARIAEILIDAEVSTLLVDRANKDLAQAALTTGGRDVICIEDVMGSGCNASTLVAYTGALATILYTSGSTGKPKGVMYSHEALLQGTRGLVEAVDITPADRLTLLAPLAYAAPLSQVFAALYAGATIVPFDLRREGVAQLARWIAETGVTIYHSVAAVMRELLASVSDTALLHSVRLLRLGGGPAAPSDADILQKLPPGCQVWTNYAATEHWLGLFTLVDRNTSLDPSLPHIALRTAMPGVEVLLLDEHDQPVADGEVGEIVVVSDALAEGYWRQPQLTAERFTPDPRTGRGRVCRTRDLARRLPDGGLLHMGRSDQVIKIRGMRVDPTEVAAVLAQHPDVAEAAVLSATEGDGSPILLGFLAPHLGSAVRIDEIHRFATEHLLSAMVPARYALLARLPRTSHGKVDREALRNFEATAPSSGGGAQPLTRLEQQLAAIWREVLATDSVSLHDDFFSVGGHSLLALRLFARIETVFGLRLPLTSFFPDATLGNLARRVEGALVDPADILVPLQTGGSLPPLVCVHPVDGDVLRFITLARHLGCEQPFYALRAPGLVEPNANVDDMTELGERYAERLRSAFEGPYYLAGFSFGGAVAVEIARCLLGMGEKVAFVGLLDAPAPGGSVRDGLGMLPSDVVEHAQFKWQQARSQGLRAALLEKDLLETIGEFSAQHLAVAVAHRRAWQRAHPRLYPGKLVVFRAGARRLLSTHDASLGWSRLAAGGVEVRRVPGRHEAILREPHVRRLAHELADALSRARLLAD